MSVGSIWGSLTWPDPVSVHQPLSVKCIMCSCVSQPADSAAPVRWRVMSLRLQSQDTSCQSELGGTVTPAAVFISGYRTNNPAFVQTTLQCREESEASLQTLVLRPHCSCEEHLVTCDSDHFVSGDLLYASVCHCCPCDYNTVVSSVCWPQMVYLDQNTFK